MVDWQAAGTAGADQLAALLPTVRAFAIPMPTRFRGVTVREGALIHGPAGWGEFSPFAEYGPRECARWLACALEAACAGWPSPVRDRVGVNVTVPAVGPDRAHEIVAGSGCRTAKVKVAERGQPDSDDLARVEAVRDAIGPSGRVRVDANGGWSVEHAVRMLRALGRFGLEYAEQPCATLAELAELRRLVDVPLAADESIRRAEDPMAVRAAGAADIVVLKAQPLGGVRAALRMADACGLPVVVSSAVESSVGLAAGVALAAALPELPYDCGLATMSLLSGDVTAAPLAAADGKLPVRCAVVDPGALAGSRLDPEPWRDRMRAAAAYLGAGLAAPLMNPSTAFGHRVGRRADQVRSARGGGGAGIAQRAAGHGTVHAPAAGRAAAARADRRAVGRIPRARPGQGERPSGRAVVCTSGTAAAHFHAAVIEADKAGVPLLVLTADRPPELRGTGANQTIDQLKLYGGAVRWFCEAGVPEERPGMVRYWRSLACRAWAIVSGDAGGPSRSGACQPAAAGSAGARRRRQLARAAGRPPGARTFDGRASARWYAARWTGGGRSRHRCGAVTVGRCTGLDRARGGGVRRRGLRPRAAADAGRGRRVAGAGRAVVGRPERAERPVRLRLPARLAGIRRRAPARPHRLGGAARPVPRPARRSCAERRGRSRPGTWCSVKARAGGLIRPERPPRSRPGRAARGAGRAGPGLAGRSWLAADAAARRAADEMLGGGRRLSEPRLARDLAAAAAGRRRCCGPRPACPSRDLDQHMAPRAGLRVLASQGSQRDRRAGVIGHRRGPGPPGAGGGPAAALLGDLALVHDAPGLMLGPRSHGPTCAWSWSTTTAEGSSPRWSRRRSPSPFERVFGTPHGTDMGQLSGPAGLPYLCSSTQAACPTCCAGTACGWSRCAPTGPRAPSSAPR